MYFKKILILGANSFSGNSLVNYYLNKNKSVVGISRSTKINKIMSSFSKNKNVKNYKFYQLDINKDLKKILSITNSFKPDIIINYTAQGDVRHSWNNPSQWYQTNCIGTVNFSSELINKSYLRKYVAISTPEVFGSSPNSIIETNNFNPSTPYAASKLAGDLHLMTLFKKYDFPVVFTRSSNVYGPHQQLYRIIPKTIIKIMRQEVIDLHGKGRGRRDFINIEDVNRAIHLIINKGENGESYNIANNSNLISIYDLVKKISLIMEVKNWQRYIKLVDENFGQDHIYKLNTTKIRKIGWKEKVTIESGIKQTIMWIKKYWKYIDKMPHEYIHKA